MTWDVRTGLADRAVVVTGAGGGIGSAVANALAEAGARVLGVDRPGSGIDVVVAGLPGGPHAAVETDLADLTGHAGVFARAAELGPLAGLAHVAAVLVRRASVDEVTEADWDLQHDVNLKATFFLDRAARDALRRAGNPGAIVNFASQGWWTGGVGGSVVYAASKGGVVSLTRGLAREFAADGVRVNAVSPGGVDTPMMRSGLSEEDLAVFVAGVPAGRLAAPAELAGAVVYLLSDASSYVTGTVLNVSGGQLMY